MTHIVVVNHEGQYSLWPGTKPVPAGWEPTGFRGSKEECLDRIASDWTDIRPRSIRSGDA